MKLTPRKAEVHAVAQLLESDGYDSADDLAKDVIKCVAGLFAERDWHAYAWRSGPGSQVLAWGPLSSDAEVKKLAGKAALGGEGLHVKLYSTAAMLDRIAANEGIEVAICRCSHPKFTHEHERGRGECHAERCGCKSFSKRN